ncbi:MAG: hypothetical protein AAF727_13080, partial [Pseudomonadota bacterium]
MTPKRLRATHKTPRIRTQQTLPLLWFKKSSPKGRFPIPPDDGLAAQAITAYFVLRRVSALLVTGCIPVALSNSEGAGSVRILVRLPGTHLY